jgi:hypothetical protein
MTKEIIRPCTLWGQTFDAMKVHSVIVTLELMRKEEIVLVRVRDEEDGFIYIKHPTSPNHKEADLLQEAITTIAKALNPLIEVTQAVLYAMEKVPEASFWYVEGSVNVRLKWDETLKTFTVNGQTLSITDYIQADCPLALQVLFQFNTEGELL